MLVDGSLFAAGNQWILGKMKIFLKVNSKFFPDVKFLITFSLRFFIILLLSLRYLEGSPVLRLMATLGFLA